MSGEDQTTTITMTRDEALVFNELLMRLDREDGYAIPAERRVVWNLICLLERELVEPFVTNYPEQVADARRRLGAEFTGDG